METEAIIRVRKTNERCFVEITIDFSEINLPERQKTELVRLFSDVANLVKDVYGGWIYENRVTISYLSKPTHQFRLFSGSAISELEPKPKRSWFSKWLGK